ncbi:MAG TPA: hypothetical protein VGB30_04835 [bacterium]|jgi:hypothetical protein
MEPLYKWTDSSESLKWLLLVTGILMLVMPFAVNMEGEPVAAVWIFRVTMLFSAALLFFFLPEVRGKAWEDHLEVKYGFTGLVGFKLDYSKIKSIKAVEYNGLKDFGGWGIKGGAGKWKGWTAFTASITNTAIAVETTEKNYLVGCQNPEEAESMLRNIVGLG